MHLERSQEPIRRSYDGPRTSRSVVSTGFIQYAVTGSCRTIACRGIERDDGVARDARL